MANIPLSDAIKEAGGQAKLAEQIGVRQSHISFWLTRAKRGVPAEQCAAIETATGGRVSRHDLRPDIFGPTPSSLADRDTAANGSAA